MPDLKISQLTDGGELLPTDSLAAVRAGVNVKVAAGSLGFYKLTIASTPGQNVVSISPTLPAGSILNPMMVAVDAYTTQCEIRNISSVSGSAVTFTSNLIFDHYPGALVMLLPYGTITPEMFGAKTGTSDSWLAIQRMLYQASSQSATVTTRGGYGVAGQGPYDVSQPIFVDGSTHIDSLHIETRAGFQPTDPTGQFLVYLMSVANGIVTVTNFDPATNIITCTSGGGQLVATTTTHYAIAFNTPYSGTLPADIIPGKIYFLHNVYSSTSFDIQDTPTHGAPVHDITGTGVPGPFCWLALNTLTRAYIGELRLDCDVPDVGGLLVGLQQPSYIRSCRVQMEAPATVASGGQVFGIRLDGQISQWDHIETVGPGGDSNVYCMGIYGIGHHVDAINNQGGEIGIIVGGSATGIDYYWSESPARCGILVDAVRGLHVSTMIHANAGVPALLVTSPGTASWKIGMLYSSGLGNSKLIQDDVRGYTLLAWDGGSTGNSDRAFVLGGIRQMYNPTGGGLLGPELTDRVYRAVSANYTIQYIDKYIIVSTGGVDKTITLPNASGWMGWEVTIRKGDTSAALNIVGTSGQTIDSAASYVMPAGSLGAITVISNGSGWYIASEGVKNPSAYTASNVITDRAYDANITSLDELSDVVGTLISDLKYAGVLT
jgi:hypothetical protein